MEDPRDPQDSEDSEGPWESGKVKAGSGEIVALPDPKFCDKPDSVSSENLQVSERMIIPLGFSFTENL